MRRTLAGLMPALSAQFHLRPQDYDDMTTREIAAYVNQYMKGVSNG